jgi:hypothetical protein
MLQKNVAGFFQSIRARKIHIAKSAGDGLAIFIPLQLGMVDMR